MSGMTILGIIGLVAAGACAAVVYVTRKQVRIMGGTETVPIGELRAMHAAATEAGGGGEFRYRCEVIGAARTRKSGPLTSELKKVKCVWHKHKVTRKYWTERRDSNGHRRRDERTEVVARNVSSAPVVVEDDTGRIAVRLDKHEIDGPEKVMDRFKRADDRKRGGELKLGSLSIRLPSGGGGGTIGYQQEEWAVRPGQQLYVLGEASDEGGRLVMTQPSDGGLFMASTRSEGELTRRARTIALAGTIGGVIAAGAGVALLVISLAT